MAFAANSTQAEATLDLPIELRNEVQRLEILGERNAAATFLFDDRWQRRPLRCNPAVHWKMPSPCSRHSIMSRAPLNPMRKSLNRKMRHN